MIRSRFRRELKLAGGKLSNLKRLILKQDKSVEGLRERLKAAVKSYIRQRSGGKKKVYGDAISATVVSKEARYTDMYESERFLTIKASSKAWR